LPAFGCRDTPPPISTRRRGVPVALSPPDPGLPDPLGPSSGDRSRTTRATGLIATARSSGRYSPSQPIMVLFSQSLECYAHLPRTASRTRARGSLWTLQITRGSSKGLDILISAAHA
jgi:hypothetical protein